MVQGVVRVGCVMAKNVVPNARNRKHCNVFECPSGSLTCSALGYSKTANSPADGKEHQRGCWCARERAAHSTETAHHRVSEVWVPPRLIQGPGAWARGLVAPGHRAGGLPSRSPTLSGVSGCHPQFRYLELMSGKYSVGGGGHGEPSVPARRAGQCVRARPLRWPLDGELDSVDDEQIAMCRLDRLTDGNAH